MNTIFRVVGVTFILIIVFLSSCKDDEPTLNRDLLIAKPWNLTSLNLKITQGIISIPYDGYAEIDDCNKDDLFDFLENGQLQILSNTIVCNPSDGEVLATGNWVLGSSTLGITSDYFIEILNNNPLVPFSIDNEQFDFDIKQLTSTSLQLFTREVFSDPGNPQSEYTVEINLGFVAVDIP